MGLGRIAAGGVLGLCLLTVRWRVDLTCVSGVALVGRTGRSLSGSSGVRVASFSRCEVSAVGLPNDPPRVPRAGANVLPNRLLVDVWVGVSSCSPMGPSPGTVCGGVNAVPRLGMGNSPGLPNREGVFPGVDSAPGGGVSVDPDVAFVDGVPRENGCILDKSGFLFCDPDVFH
jgi:hypothetical protein